MIRRILILLLLVAACAALFFALRSPAAKQVVSIPVPPTQHQVVVAISNTPSAKPEVVHPMPPTAPTTPVAALPPGEFVIKPPPGPIEHFSDTRIPFEQRLAEVQALGKQGDAASTKTLMQLGDAPIYINRYAVEALGEWQGAGMDVRAYLSAKVNSPDALMAIAAIKALGQVASGAAIPVLAQSLVDNQTRSDGLQNMVCTAAVQELGLTASSAAAPSLISQLQRAGTDPNWDLDYGSAVIHALRNIDSAGGAQAIAAYADVLTARLPSDPMARAFYQRKIAEARGTLMHP